MQTANKKKIGRELFILHTEGQHAINDITSNLVFQQQRRKTFFRHVYRSSLMLSMNIIGIIGRRCRRRRHDGGVVVVVVFGDGEGNDELFVIFRLYDAYILNSFYKRKNVWFLQKRTPAFLGTIVGFPFLLKALPP